MQYSKHFETEDGLVIIFDKLETSREYPLFYAAVREGNKKHSVYIPKKKFKLARTLGTGTIKILTFIFSE